MRERGWGGWGGEKGGGRKRRGEERRRREVKFKVKEEEIWKSVRKERGQERGGRCLTHSGTDLFAAEHVEHSYSGLSSDNASQ